MKIGVVPFALGSSLADLQDCWHAAEDAGFASLWTIDHATSTNELRPAWEASSLFVAMAARTQSIPIGVLVFDVLLRHPFLLAGSVAVAQALSGGRVTVGLGVGDAFSRRDHDALGLGFPPMADRIRTLDAACAALPALWRGEAVTEPLLGLDNAALGPCGIGPPSLVIGGAARGLMEVAARHGQGWNLYTQEPDAFATHVRELEEVEGSHPGVYLSRSVYLFANRVRGDIRSLPAEFAAAGADEAMLVVMQPSSAAILELARKVL